MTWLRRSLPVAAVLGAMALVAVGGLWWARVPPAPGVLAAPNAFSGPVNGGCYLETPVECRIHIDGWQPIVTDPGQKLVGFQLSALRQDQAAMTLLHDFRTDVSNPPGGAYPPSLVRQDYAAECGTTYVLMMSVKDSGDLGFEQVGQTTAFTCPAAATPTATVTAYSHSNPTVGDSSATPPPQHAGSTVTITPTATATLSSTPAAPDWLVFLPAVRGE